MMQVTGNKTNKHTRTSILMYRDGFSFFDACTLQSKEYILRGKELQKAVLEAIESSCNQKPEMLVYSTDEFVLLPSELYDPNHTADYFKSKNITLHAGQSIVSSRHKEMIFLTAIETVFYEQILKVSDHIKIIHPLLHSLILSDLLEITHPVTILANKTYNKIQLLVFEEHKLVFCEALPMENDNDLYFYLTRLSRKYQKSDISFVGAGSLHNTELFRDIFSEVKSLSIESYFSF